MPLSRTLLVTIITGTATMAAAQEITGIANVIDGRTIAIGAQTLHLAGVDAPEPGQRCERNGQSYDCGQEASWALADRLGRHWVQCDETGRSPAGVIEAVCYLGGRHGIDVNASMVRQGWAIAVPGSSVDYADVEAAARRERLGMWAGSFTQFRSR